MKMSIMLFGILKISVERKWTINIMQYPPRIHLPIQIRPNPYQNPIKILMLNRVLEYLVLPLLCDNKHFLIELC